MSDRSRRQESFRAALVAKKAQVALAKVCCTPLTDPFRGVVEEMTPGRDLAQVEARRLQLNAVLSFDEVREFVRAVWSVERPGALPVQVCRVEDFSPAARAAMYHPDMAAEARWDRPYNDQFGITRSGELFGTSGPVPYIAVSDESLDELSLLHEISHLIVDTETTLQGHNEVWSNEFARLLTVHVDPFTAMEWAVMLDWAHEWAQRKSDADPDWPLASEP